MNSQDSSSSWLAAMNAIADVTLRDGASGDEEIIRGTHSTGWDPAEVWLSRIKRPRDRAAKSLAAGFPVPTS
jgi:hypothetical protein